VHAGVVSASQLRDATISWSNGEPFEDGELQSTTIADSTSGEERRMFFGLEGWLLSATDALERCDSALNHACDDPSVGELCSFAVSWGDIHSGSSTAGVSSCRRGEVTAGGKEFVVGASAPSSESDEFELDSKTSSISSSNERAWAH
jgi:hypothetical protein